MNVRRIVVVKVIASDMDGTFLNEKGTFDEQRFQTELDQMADKQMHFISASSNHYQHLLNLFQNISGPVSYVCNNGALVVNEQGVIVSEDFIDHPVLEKALDWLMTTPSVVGAEIILVGRNGTYCNLPADSERFKASKYFYEDMQSMPDLKLVFDSIYKIDLMWESGSVFPRQSDLNHKFSGQLTAVSSGMNGMDVMAAGVSKLTGIQTLLDQWGLAFDDVAAFGDNGNDFEMVNAAHEGFAMKNAAQDLLARVDHVTDLTNDESGVQERIDHYLSEK